jgi:hypothetical protein
MQKTCLMCVEVMTIFFFSLLLTCFIRQEMFLSEDFCFEWTLYLLMSYVGWFIGIYSKGEE